MALCLVSIRLTLALGLGNVRLVGRVVGQLRVVRMRILRVGYGIDARFAFVRHRGRRRISRYRLNRCIGWRCRRGDHCWRRLANSGSATIVAGGRGVVGWVTVVVTAVAVAVVAAAVLITGE